MYYGINKQEPYPITFIQGDIIMESESKYEFSPFAPGIPLSEKPCKKAPAKVCTIWDDEEEKFCIHNGCILGICQSLWHTHLKCVRLSSLNGHVFLK